MGICECGKNAVMPYKEKIIVNSLEVGSYGVFVCKECYDLLVSKKIKYEDFLNMNVKC